MNTSNSGGSQSADAKDTSASAPPSLIDLIRTAVRFYDLAAGEGLVLDGQPDPADYIAEFLDANIDAWDRLDSFVAEAVAAKDAEIQRLRADLTVATMRTHVLYSTRLAAGRLRAELGVIGTDQPDVRKLLAFVERRIEDASK